MTGRRRSTRGPAQYRRGWARRLPGGIATLGVAMVLASCSAMENVVADEDAGPRVAKVVVLAPGDTASGEAVQAAVELAIAETASDIGGWTIEVEFAADDAHDDGPAELARELVEDDVIAVVGGMSTEVVRAVQPVFDSDSVLFVSPADTVAEHTRGADPGRPLRPYSSYYRTSPISEQPLHALARHAVGALEASSVAVIDAGDPDEAGVFADAVDEAGGDVIRLGEGDAEDADGQDDDANAQGQDDDDQDDDADGQGQDDDNGGATGDGGGGEQQADADDVGEGTRELTKADVSSMLKEARDREAGAVFAAGRASVAATVADELARMGLDIELLGGSAMMSDNFLAEAGSAAEGAWTATKGELTSLATSNSTDLEAKLADAGVSSPGRYAAAAYDAGLAVGTVLTGCLPSASTAQEARQGCTGEMAEVTVAGSTGEVAFDDFGDRAGSRPELMVVRGGTWTPAEPEQ